MKWMMVVLWDMCIIDEETLSKKEMKEIEESTEDLNDDKLEEEGWHMLDTNYIMVGPVKLELE